MNPRTHSRLWPLLCGLAAAVTLQAALAAGGVAFTKRMETKLLAEPTPLAAVSAKVGYAKPLKIEAAKGAWLKVREGENTGWVFSGNVSAVEIKETAGLAGLGLNASATTVTAAARGLSEEAADYAQRHQLGTARDDLAWLLEQSAAVTAEDLEAFLQKNKLGEFK
ncbi:MAG: hypothetical protein HYX71_06025 [Opitutae bacterium]|nr:hypothetical protein [Opitutae bacterium]